MNLGSMKQVERQKSHLGDRIINIEMTKSIYFIIAQRDITAENSGKNKNSGTVCKRIFELLRCQFLNGLKNIVH